MCHTPTKRAYGSKREAKADAKRWSKHSRPYQCRTCGMWHITSTSSIARYQARRRAA